MINGDSSEDLDLRSVDLTEVIAQLSDHNPTRRLYPTRATPCETLSDGYIRSYAGFLICNLQREIQVDQEIVK
jgi:hypothetical protein